VGQLLCDWILPHPGEAPRTTGHMGAGGERPRAHRGPYRGRRHLAWRGAHPVPTSPSLSRRQLSGFKNEAQWKREYPNHIPIATACGVIGFFL
jgi:hypothetical protein